MHGSVSRGLAASARGMARVRAGRLSRTTRWTVGTAPRFGWTGHTHEHHTDTLSAAARLPPPWTSTCRLPVKRYKGRCARAVNQPFFFSQTYDPEESSADSELQDPLCEPLFGMW